MFDKVVKLTVNQCVQGMTSEQVQFRDLLLRLGKGDSTVVDWKLLLTRQPSNVTNLCDFEDSARLFYSNEQVANYNHEQLMKLEHPIAPINARHSSALAKKISSDDMSGLEPVVFLAKGARVMLTMNLWILDLKVYKIAGSYIHKNMEEDFTIEVRNLLRRCVLSILHQLEQRSGESSSLENAQFGWSGYWV
ncbi:Hypothetical predicted protein [Paramuricea clavata]|uniref:Uncharacterized protein n=1 Tax=Paramuricea clavata TaxID=317549 RepID=A0A7D9DZR5_PARCT|nr:Hypothetical predicted protein [Paramuricea clavata]